jgi:hypothetical protein
MFSISSQDYMEEDMNEKHHMVTQEAMERWVPTRIVISSKSMLLGDLMTSY